MKTLIEIAIILLSGFNIYSPDLVYQNNQLVMYSGGWYTAAGVPSDKIYRSVCSAVDVCGVPVEVIAPGGLYQVNDPTLVQMPGGYWIMYMTGNTGTINNIYYSTSWDGVIWSTPALLIPAHWLPSATIKNGHVYLYATQSGTLEVYDLGTSGVAVGTPVTLSMPQEDYYWLNVDVAYQPSIDMWQMVGENFYYDQSSVFIDYLYSTDGINWSMGISHIVDAENGGSVRTPAMHPGSAYYVYFGCSATRDGMSNQICFEDWSD